MAEMKSPNAHAKKNRNDTPQKRKTHIIKVRVTAEEKLRIAYACKELHLTQSELVRRVLYGVNGDHEQGLCLFTRFALQNLQRALRFDF